MTKRPTARARRLRQDATSAERGAWEVLRRFRGLGFPVRRLHPIAGLIVDFAIPKVTLAIEIDGGIHELPEVAARDRVRDTLLRDAGWRILRLRNVEAMDQDRLFAVIAAEVGL